MTTLAKIKTPVVAVEAGEVSTDMSVIMPPGFEEPVNRPMIFIGGESENGPCFYTWNRDEERRDYVPVNRFSATLLSIKTVVRNPDNDLTRSVKIVAEFQTSSGALVAMSCGANTYSALGMVAGLSACSEAELNGELGLSGRTGKNGKVTFVSVFASSQLKRNPDAEELLKEAKRDGVMTDAIEGYIQDINNKITTL